MNRVNHRLIETRTQEREKSHTRSLSLVVARCLSLARISSLARNHLVAVEYRCTPDLIEAILTKHQRETPMASKQELRQQRRQKQLNDALIEAAKQDSLADIQSLLDQHADINSRNFLHSTPLHYASMNGNHQCIEILLDRHADINALANNNSTPLHNASSNGHHQCIELLLDRHADINALGCYNNTPLHCASLIGNRQCIEILLDYGADKSFINVRLSLSL